MGQAPIGWESIEAWKRLTGTSINGWEAGVLRKMSSAYLAEYQQAKDPHRPPPYLSKMDDKKRDLVSKKIGDVFARIKARKR